HVPSELVIYGPAVLQSNSLAHAFYYVRPYRVERVCGVAESPRGKFGLSRFQKRIALNVIHEFHGNSALRVRSFRPHGTNLAYAQAAQSRQSGPAQLVHHRSFNTR